MPINNYQSDYAKKLKDPRWQKKRLEILQRDNFGCMKCFSDSKTLHVHHRLYNKGVDPWDYENEYLVTLCEDCHQEETERMGFAMEKLTREFKRLFFSEEIDTITEGIKNYQHIHVTSISAEVIASLFSEQEYKAKDLDKIMWYEGKDIKSTEQLPF